MLKSIIMKYGITKIIMATVISIGLVGGGVYAAISSDGSDKITASSTETAVEADSATVDTAATVDNTDAADETVNVETTSAASTDKSAAKTSEKAAKSSTTSKADSKSTNTTSSKTSSTKSNSSNKASTSTKSSKSSTSATKSHTHNWVAHKTNKTTYKTESYQKEVTICSDCGADISGHAVQHLIDYDHNGYYGSTATKTRQVPVTTTVIDYYYCSSCGATK